MAARNRQVSLLELDGTSLCVYVQTKENPLSAEELHWWTIHRQQCEVQVSRWWLYSRWAWELLWQLKAREKINPHHIWRLFTNSGFRTKSARDQPPNQGGPQGMSIFINFRQHVGLCALKSEHFTRLADLQWSQLIDENLSFGSAVSEAKFLTERQRKFVCVEREL